MHIFQIDDFDEYYKKVLQDGISERKYIDPDSVEDVSKTDYYYLLTKFLTERELEFCSKKDGKPLIFLYPQKAKKPDGNDINMDAYNDKIDASKIVAIQKNEVIYRITSDQFGFSAVESIYVDKKEKYPLCKINSLSSNLVTKERNKTVNTIVDYVKYSRTLGGAFVWPLPSNGCRVCDYNRRRGNYSGKDKNPIQGYIEDRVDLTLLEIKHALEGDYDKGEHKSDLLYDEYCKNEIMKKWLKHFSSFDEYIHYFMLDCFVREGMPINIITGSIVSEADIKSYKDQFKEDKIGQLQKLSFVELLALLVRLETMILERTYQMEKYLKEKAGAKK